MAQGIEDVSLPEILQQMGKWRERPQNRANFTELCFSVPEDFRCLIWERVRLRHFFPRTFHLMRNDFILSATLNEWVCDLQKGSRVFPVRAVCFQTP